MPPQVLQFRVDLVVSDEVMERLVSIATEIIRQLPLHSVPPAPTLKQDNGPRFLTSPDAAKLLNISVRAMLRLAEHGKMPQPIRLGHSVRWSVEELKAWMEAGAPNTADWRALKKGS